jgi:hypothetical protein
VAAGQAGIGGDLWGNQQGALHINSSTQYDLQNIKIYNIDLYDSKNDAIFIGSGTKSIKNLLLKNIQINGTNRYGILFSGAKGNGIYCNISYENIGAGVNYNVIPATFTFTEDCSIVSSPIKKDAELKAFAGNGEIFISGKENTPVAVYDIWGRKRFQTSVAAGQAKVTGLNSGIYIVRWNELNSLKLFVH